MYKEILDTDRILSAQLPWYDKDVDSPAVFLGDTGELQFMIRADHFHPVMHPKAKYTDDQIDDLVIKGFLTLLQLTLTEEDYKTVRNQAEAVEEAERYFAGRDLEFARLLTHADSSVIPKDFVLGLAGPDRFLGTYIEDDADRFSFFMCNPHAVVAFRVI